MSRSVLALAVVLSGCLAVNDPSRHQTDEPIEPAQLCEQIVDVLCRGIEDCCGFEFIVDCRIQLQIGCLRNVAPLALEGRNGYDPVRAREVVRRGYQAVASCDAELYRELATSGEEGFFSVFRGTRAVGESCETPNGTLPFECGATARCVPEAGGMERTLSCAPLGQMGEVCLQSSNCERALYCARAGSVVPQCRPRLAAGNACSRDAECESAICSETCVPATETAFCINPFHVFDGEALFGIGN